VAYNPLKIKVIFAWQQNFSLYLQFVTTIFTKY